MAAGKPPRLADYIARDADGRPILRSWLYYGMNPSVDRAGYFLMPMDETLGIAAVDLSGRPHAVVDLGLRVRIVGDLQTELLHDFFEGFAQGARANVHVKVMYGRSNHHRVEAVFKAFARAMRVACAKDKQMLRALPSTKGLL